MNQQLYLLAAQAAAREREHRLSTVSGSVRRGRARHLRTLGVSLSTPRRRPAAREAGSPSAQGVPARG